MATALTAYPVPWTGNLPIDLMGRFEHGRVVPIGMTERLKSLFGAVAMAPGVEWLPLAKHLLRTDNARTSCAGSAGYLTEDVLWERWLALDWGLGTGGTLAQDTLLVWAAENARGPQFARAMEHPRTSDVREALLEHLRQRLGPLGPLIWRQWEAGRGADLLALGILCEEVTESHREEDAVVRVWVRQNLKTRFDTTDDALLGAAQQLGEISSLAMRMLEHAAPEQAQSRTKLAREIVARANSWADEDIRSAVSCSRRLLTAWHQRLYALVASQMLEAREASKAERRKLAGAVEFLREHGDGVSAEAFAEHTGHPTWRIGGVVSALSEKLNVDGYQVLSFDAQSRRVVLNRELLFQQFEVKL